MKITACLARTETDNVHIGKTGMHHLQASKAEDTDAEGLRVKLRAAVKKGKAIEKQRADLAAQLTSLREQVLLYVFISSVKVCKFDDTVVF